MLLRPFLYETTTCASYLFGCGTQSKLAVVDPHVDLVDEGARACRDSAVAKSSQFAEEIRG